MNIEFICKSCGRDLMQGDDFKYAAFLYGVFFLEGPDDGFVGTTCPSCLKTAYIIVDNAKFEAISDDIRYTFRFRGEEFVGYFKYFSPIAAFRMYGSRNDPTLLSDEYVSIISTPDDIPLDGPHFDNAEHQNLYSSYGRWSQPVMGEFFHNIWVNYEQALNLIEIENEYNVRTIPRFTFKNDLLIKSEELFQEYYDAREVHKQFAEALPGFPIIEEYTNKEAKLHDTLTTPPKLNNFPPFKSIPELLWTKRHPFIGLNPEQRFSEAIISEKNSADYSCIIEAVKCNYNKEYSLRFLGEYIDYFFHDYTKDELYSIMQANWSHADLWKLVLRYLSQYHWVVEKGLREEQNYFFYREGESFRMRFGNGKPKSGLKGKGFQYIHHLMCNEGQGIPAETLYSVCHNSGDAVLDSLLKEDLNISNRQDGFIEMSDAKTRADARERVRQLKEELVTIKALGKKDKIQEINNEIEKLEGYLDDCFRPNGKVKVKRSDAEENKAGSVNKAIDDALKKLASDKVGYKEAAKYLKNSLKNRHGKEIKFQSADQKINWYL